MSPDLGMKSFPVSVANLKPGRGKEPWLATMWVDWKQKLLHPQLLQSHARHTWDWEEVPMSALEKEKLTSADPALPSVGSVLTHELMGH